MKKILANLEHYKYFYLVAFLSMAAGIVYLIPNPPPRITKVNFDKIEKEMTQAEVEEILGPGADHSAHPERVVSPGIIDGIRGGGDHSTLVWKYWDGEKGTISVGFQDDKVLDKNWHPEISLWDRFKEELDR
jgi:hypothetical protein